MSDHMEFDLSTPSTGSAQPVNLPTITGGGTDHITFDLSEGVTQPTPAQPVQWGPVSPRDLWAPMKALPAAVDQKDLMDGVNLAREMADNLGLPPNLAYQALKYIAPNERKRQPIRDGLSYSNLSAQESELWYESWELYLTGKYRTTAQIDTEIKSLQGMQEVVALSGGQADFQKKIEALTKERVSWAEREQYAQKLADQLKTIDDLYGAAAPTEAALPPPANRFEAAVRTMVALPGKAIGALPGTFHQGADGGGDIGFQMGKAAGDQARAGRWGITAAVPTTAIGAGAGALVAGVGALPGAAAGFTTGFTLGSSAYWARQITGGKFKELMNGGVDPKVALILSGVFGAMEAAVETLGDVQLYKAAIPGYQKALHDAIRGGAQELLADPRFGMMAAEATQRLAKATATETWEEVTQNWTDFLEKYIADRISGTKVAPEVLDYWKNQWKTVQITPALTLGIAGAGAGLQMVQGAVQDARQATAKATSEAIKAYATATTEERAQTAEDTVKIVGATLEQLNEVEDKVSTLEEQRTELVTESSVRNTEADIQKVDEELAQVNIVRDAMIESIGAEMPPEEEGLKPVQDRQEMADKATAPEAKEILTNPVVTGEELRTSIAETDAQIAISEAAIAKMEEAPAKEAVIAPPVEAFAVPPTEATIPPGGVAQVEEKMAVAEPMAVVAERETEAARVAGVEQIAAEEEAYPITAETPVQEAVRRTLEEERQHVKDLKDKKKALMDLRDYRRKLVKTVMGPVSATTVDVVERTQIEAMQDGVNKRKMGPKKLAELKASQAYFQAHPEEVQNLKPAKRKRLGQKTLNELTVGDLETMASEVQKLRHMGTLRRRLELAQRDRRIAGDKKTVMATLAATKATPLAPSGDRYPAAKEGLAGKLRAARLSPMGNERVIDAFDGGKLFKGPIHEILWNALRDVEAKAMGNVAKMKRDLSVKMKEWGITEKTLTKMYEFGGQKYTKSDILAVVAGWMNEKNRAALQGKGMGITPEMKLEMAKTVKATELKLIEWIQNAYNEQHPRVRQAHISLDNEDPGSEANYIPMKRFGAQFDTFVEDLKDEIAYRKALKLSLPSNKKRVEIAPENQSKIKLDLVGTFMSEYERHEHYAQFAEPMAHLAKVFGDPEVQKMLESKRGAEANLWLKNYLGAVAETNMNKVLKGKELMDKVFDFAGGMKRSMGLAFLAFRPMTALKNFLSMPKALPYTGVHIFSGMAEMAKNPVETIKFVYENDGVMAGRIYDRFLDDLKTNDPSGHAKLKSTLGENGMKGIWFVDSVVSALVWKSVYNKNLEKLGHDGAVQEARNVVLRTQSVGNSAHLPELMRSKNAITQLLTIFGIDQNQTWNILTYDVPQLLAHSKFLTAGATLIALTAGMMVGATLTNRRLPKDEKEAAEWVAQEYIASIPILGSMAVSKMRGWQSKLDIPLIGAAEAVIGGVQAMTSGRWSKVEQQMGTLAYALAVINGLPAQQGRAIWEGIVKLSKGQTKEALYDFFAGGQPLKD